MEHLNAVLSKLNHLDLNGQIEDIQTTAKGLGASCEVFKGYWRAGKKQVAVKKLRIFLTKEDQVVKRLAREIYIWSKLEHANVLPLLGFFVEGGDFPHLVSEWMERGTLREYMPKLGWDTELVEMARGIAAGLSYLHEIGVVHADLKSLNVLISQSQEPMLADFGLSHVLTASMTRLCGTTMASSKGTVRWMAIELLAYTEGSSTSPNEKSDVWAFGMTLYEMLTRGVPYSHLKNDPLVALAISSGERPERPSLTEKAALPVLERRLWDLCGICWKKEPRMRPSMKDVLSFIAVLQIGSSSLTKRRKLTVATPGDDADRRSSDTLVDMPMTKKRGRQLVTEFEEGGSKRTKIVTPTFRVSESANFLDKLNSASHLSEFRKEGGDWCAFFNPKVKKQLDVEVVHILEHKSVVCCVCFSADGKFLATCCKNSTQIYDTKMGVRTRLLVDESLCESDLYIRCACFSSDGMFLATGGEDAKIRIWDIPKQQIYRVFEGHEQEVYSVAFSPDGRFIVSGSCDRTVRIWSFVFGAHKTFEIMAPETVDAGVTSVSLTPDGRFVAAASLDSTVYIWDIETGALVERLHGHVDSVYSVVFTPNGCGLVSGGLDASVKYWDVTPITRRDAKRRLPMDNQKRILEPASDFAGHKDYVLAVAISHDDRWIVSGTRDRSVHFWDRQTEEVHLRLEGHKSSGT